MGGRRRRGQGPVKNRGETCKRRMGSPPAPAGWDGRLLLLLGRCCWRFLARRNVRNVGQMRDLTASRVINADAGVVEQLSGGAVELEARLFIRGHGGKQRGFGCGEGAAILQNRGGRGGAELIFLLLGVRRAE